MGELFCRFCTMLGTVVLNETEVIGDSMVEGLLSKFGGRSGGLKFLELLEERRGGGLRIPLEPTRGSGGGRRSTDLKVTTL